VHFYINADIDIQRFEIFTNDIFDSVPKSSDEREIKNH